MSNCASRYLAPAYCTEDYVDIKKQSPIEYDHMINCITVKKVILHIRRNVFNVQFYLKCQFSALCHVTIVALPKIYNFCFVVLEVKL